MKLDFVSLENTKDLGVSLDARNNLIVSTPTWQITIGASVVPILFESWKAQMLKGDNPKALVQEHHLRGFTRRIS